MGCQKEGAIPVVDFEADSTVTEQRMEVRYTDLSLNNPTEWSWRFEAGDPQFSTEKNPVVRYHHAGEFEVRLSVSNEYGTDVKTKDNYIHVLATHPEADFSADTTVCEINGIIRFKDLSTGNPHQWNWTFQGGTPQTSNAQNPIVIYENPGDYSVILTISNSRGTDTESKKQFIKVRYPRTDLWFHNHVYTDVEVHIERMTETVPPGDSIVIRDIEGYTADFYASTSGKTANGSVIGQSVYWEGRLNLNGLKMNVDLDLSQSYFFLYISNHGTHNLSPLFVNYGITDQSVDHIVLPADGKRYKIGYYPAHPGTIIRAYWQDDSTSFTEWKAGTDFSLTFSKNQHTHLTNLAR